MSDAAAERREQLERLYAVMRQLLALGEAEDAGTVTRAVRVAQQQLWPVIQYLGGSQEDYVRWVEPRRTPLRR